MSCVQDLALTPPSSRTSIVPLEDLLERVLAYQPNADVDLLRRAYDFATEAHEGQVRKSGDPYFVHPAAVAMVITELRLDAASVCAGLLHDVVEDTPQTVQDLERLFGKEVASLVDGVTKLSKINFTSRQEREAENFRKMLVAMSRDIRVLLVKLCDRVDNMRTLEFMKQDSQERIARETTEIFAPSLVASASIDSRLSSKTYRSASSSPTPTRTSCALCLKHNPRANSSRAR